MTALNLTMSWITVSDLEKAKKFYTEVVGLTVVEESPEFGWIELTGSGGKGRLGIAQAKAEMPAGQNAVVCISVDDLELQKSAMEAQGAKMVGEIMDIPGHVRLQTFQDADGNTLQLAEKF